MNKFAIPAILVATVMVAGIFAFMPVQQASTVHTTLGTAANLATLDANVDLILVDTGTTLNDLLDTEVADILADTAVIGALVGGAASLNADIDNTQNQIASLVTTGSAAEAGAADGNNVEAISAANTNAGVVYVTINVAEGGGTGDAQVDFEVDGGVVDTCLVANTPCTFVAATDGTGPISFSEGGTDTADTFDANAVVIATAADPT